MFLSKIKFIRNIELINITIDSLTPVPIMSETGNKQNKSIIKELDENLVNLKNTQTDSENYYTTNSHIFKENDL